MPLLRRRSVFAAKVEATIGSAESLTASEGVFNCMGLTIQPNITAEEREGQGGFNYNPSVMGQRSGTATFSTEAYYDGSTVPAWASVLLPGCGFVETTGTFAPKSEGPGGSGKPKTLTIGGYVDGVYRVLRGCMGTFTIDLPTGRMVKFNWTFQGIWTVPTDAALIDPTFPTTIPMRMAGGSVAWNSVNLCTENVTIDAGNEVILRECAGDASGLKSALVVNRKPMITANPEMVLAATQDRHAQWLTTSTAAALVITTGGSGENRLVITAPKAQIQNIQQGERSGLLTDEITWMATANDDPDEELTIAFTAAT
jgi:hypothetical protein